MQLNLVDSGAGSAVILLHGMFGSLSNLGSVSRYLSKDFRVISLDLRNHGKSGHDSVMDLPSMALDLIETLDSLNIFRAAVLGHSLGGKVAMQAALDFPERVEKLIVADISPVRYKQTHSDVLDGLIAVDQTKLNSRLEADEILSNFEADANVRGFLLTNLVRRNKSEFHLRLNVSAIAKNYYNGLMAAPIGAPFGGPALFVKAEESAYIQDKHRSEISTLFPKANIQVIPNVGHWLHVEDPKTFNKIVAGFLS